MGSLAVPPRRSAAASGLTGGAALRLPSGRESAAGCRRIQLFHRRMKTSAISSLRRKLAANEPAYGLWVTLESPAITEMAVALGLDWLVIDAEHGHLDWKE